MSLPSVKIPSMYDRLALVIACPHCKLELKKINKGLYCKKCKETYSVVNEVPVFMTDMVKDEHLAAESIGASIGRSSSFVRSLRSVIGAPDATYEGNVQARLAPLMKRSPLKLNIGSSSKKAYSGTINLDIGLFDNVDIVADGKKLPFKKDSFDLVLIENVLEHVDEPEKIIEEAYRVLKKGGKVFISLPFVFVFHGSPNDFGRFTLNGLTRRIELAGFKVERAGVLAGPSSTISQMLRYYLAILFSFNSDFLFSALLNVFGWITFPLKYLDILLRRHKKAHLMAATIYALGRK